MAFKLGQNKAYLKAALDSLLGTLNGTGFKNGIIQQTAAGVFSALTKSTAISSSSTDSEIPTAKAVKDAVDAATPAWGNITGELEDQTDLNTVLDSQSAQITNLSTNKADKTALALTDKKLQYLSDLTKGKVWTEEAGTTPAYQHTVTSGAKAVAINGIGGKTIVYNQLVQNGNFESTSGWSAVVGGGTFTADSNVATLTLGETKSNTSFQLYKRVNYIAGHKYFIACDIKLSSVISSATAFLRIYSSTAVYASYSNVPANTWIQLQNIVTVATGGNLETNIQYLYGNLLSVGDTMSAKNVMVVDLTAMFGSGNEPTTVAEVKKWFPNDYYAYNAGELVSADVTSVVSKDDDNVTLGSFTIPQNGEHSTFKSLFPMRSALEAQDWLDFEDKKHTSNIGTVDLGTLTWIKESNRYITQSISSLQKRVSSNNDVPNMLTTAPMIVKSANSVSGSANSNEIFMSLSSGQLNYYYDNTLSLSDFVSAMSGKYLYYELATPVETDISSYFTDDNLLTVEANGTLTFVQSDTTKNIYVPNDTVYAVQLSDAT